MHTRREALRIAAAGLLLPLGCTRRPVGEQGVPAGASRGDLKISLAQWSLHRELQGKRLMTLDFPGAARSRFGIAAVEYVNSFFPSAGARYVEELHARCRGEGVESVLIMCDGEGALGDADCAKRAAAVENHRKWLDAAKTLGCHSIRVNAQSSGRYKEQVALAADGLRRLAEVAEPLELNVIVENHGGLSSNGAWLAETIGAAGHPRVGTLPDFGNFRVSASETYDRYKGMREIMPFAKGVSAKSYDFDERGEETTIDFGRMLGIVRDAGYSGYVGIEYEGSRLPEHEGIVRTKALLERHL